MTLTWQRCVTGLLLLKMEKFLQMYMKGVARENYRYTENIAKKFITLQVANLSDSSSGFYWRPYFVSNERCGQWYKVLCAYATRQFRRGKYLNYSTQTAAG